MLYLSDEKIVKLGGKSAIGVYLTKPMRKLGWKYGDPVRVCATDDKKIVIEKIEK